MKNDGFLPERNIKHILYSYLKLNGWNYELIEPINREAYIVANRHAERWAIGIKGSESFNKSFSTKSIIDSFNSILGAVLQMMDDQNSKYSVALSDTKPFRVLWDKLPVLVKDRTGITALFVNQCGLVEEIAR